MIKTKQQLTPHELATKIFNQVTYSMTSIDKILKTGNYARFVVLGGFLHLNSLPFEAGMTDMKLALMEKEYRKLINRWLKIKYGPDNLLPDNFYFLRPLWKRGLFKNEQYFIDRIPEFDEHTTRHVKIIVLGATEAIVRLYYDMYDKNVGVNKTCLRYAHNANFYIEEICGVDEFFKEEDLQTIIKF